MPNLYDLAGDQARVPQGSQSAPSIFDAKYVRLLSQLKGSMHKLAMDGLKRPSTDGVPEADANTPQQSENGQIKVAALERYALRPYK
jgi:hypothetical protein